MPEGACPGATRAPATRSALELATIVRAYRDALRRQHSLTAAQQRVLDAIARCRTPALGGHLDVCDQCGDATPAYNSCRNRHCPKCQALAQAKWLAQREQRLLPTHYFHVVFTLPAELRALAAHNRAAVFDLLFAAAAQTLLDLGRDPERLGAQLGLTAELHTWTRDLCFHPHVHCVVTGGGLNRDGTQWRAVSQRYLFPVRVLGALFRGKFLAGLTRLYADGALTLPATLSAADFARLCDRLHRTSWVVYAKPPFGGPTEVFRYLGRYTHRVGLSNRRLLALDARGVTFATKHGQTTTVPAVTFLRRFVQHVLPAHFVKIRHYGLLAASNATRALETARALLTPVPPSAAPPAEAPAPPAEWRAQFLALTQRDLAACRRCGTGRRAWHPLPDAAPPSALDTS